MRVWNIWKRFVSDESGLETVEWAVIGMLIVAALVAAVAAISHNVVARFTDLSTDVPSN